MSKILILMSGGVDSSVAAGLLLEQGHDVTGVTLRLADSPPDSGRVGGCCSLADVEDARCVARFLGIPHYSLNDKEIFQRTVLANFAKEYRSGRTPNPCYRCNQWIKFDHVMNWAEGLDFDGVATGHYARIEEEGGRRYLARGRDAEKDQTYFLASIQPNVLDRILFPLADMNKAEVRKKAEELRLVTAEKAESQELCFAHDLDYRNALPNGSPGDIVDLEGNRLGSHSGITHYTIGQRKGLGLSGGPFYVVQLNVEGNQVIVGSEEDLEAQEVVVDEFNPFRPLAPGEILNAMPRYRHEGAPVEILEVGSDEVRLRFLEPERAITPGQALVLYDGDRVVAGSVIRKVCPMEPAIVE
jgi:tRNA-specific 2-thiouridylase